MAIPASQKAGDAPIAFALQLNGSLVPGAFFNLAIRPEGLRRREPSRTTVQQTRGRPFLDNFGQGLVNIEIEGHTGWRGSVDQDGGQLFHQLRESIFVQWHTLRRQQQQAGVDPDAAVEMLFIDTLNGFVEVVAPLPGGFNLQRMRGRPLLYQYSMQMVVLRDAADPIGLTELALLTADSPDPASQQIKPSALSALDRTIAARQTLAGRIQAALGPAYADVTSMVSATQAVLTEVRSAVAEGIDAFDAVTQPVIFAATSIESAARNLTQALIAPLALTEHIKGTMRDLYGNFSEAYCNLTNSFQAPSQYLNFSDLFGASNCSSTTGGRPQSIYATQNPFAALYSSAAAPVQIDAPTQNAINQANQDALVLNAQSTDYKLGLVRQIAKGIKVRPRGVRA